MKIIQACIGLVLFTSCCMPFSAGAEEYSLNDLFETALKRSEKIQIAKANVYYSHLEKTKATSLLIPKLSAFGSYVRFTEDKYNDFQYLLQPESAVQWGVRADEALSLSLRELTAREIAEHGIRKSKNDLANLKEVYLLQVAQAYYNVLTAKKSVEIAESNLARISKYRNAAVSRLKVDEVTMIVILRAESELSGAKSELARAKNAYDSAQTALARLVGIGGDFALREEKQYESQANTLPELINIAYAERADLKSLEEQVEMARKQVSYARGAYWPDLNIQGVYQKTDQEPESSVLNDESIYGSVTLNFLFFDGGFRRSELLQARTRERQAVLEYEDLKKTVAMEVENVFLELNTQRDRVKFLEDQFTFAKDNYRGVMRQFELGLANSLDVIDANDLLVSSERQLAFANYSYQLSILSLEQATGRFMKEINRRQSNVLKEKGEQ